jgi:L,D-peptidoglycan transpeptidase YkuD (ErfK/YbiS/YcfS/YnhG family)
MDIRVFADNILMLNSERIDCALGSGGVRPIKQEGDKATPVGCFPFRRVLYRADRVAPPATRLPVAALAPDDGWCDAPADPRYNRQVTLPYPARHEVLWRDDHVYDLIVIIGHNDDPPRPGAGSAIFLHSARATLAPTEGCVALHEPDLRRLLEICGPGDRLCVSSGNAPP